MGSPLSVFATVNGSAPGVGSLQVYLSLWGNPRDASAVKDRNVTVRVKHEAGKGPVKPERKPNPRPGLCSTRS